MMFTGITESGSLRGFVALDQPRFALTDAPTNENSPGIRRCRGKRRKFGRLAAGPPR